MQPEAMMEMLKTLKMRGMAQALNELAAQDSPAYKDKGEIRDRDFRKVHVNLSQANVQSTYQFGVHTRSRKPAA